MIFAGHRGVRNLYPENTFSSFYAVHKFGIPWIETDLTITKDNVPILVHDHILGRCSDIQGDDIWDMELSEVKKIDAGSWFSSEFKCEKIPTLTEFIHFVNKTGVKVNLEIKGELENSHRWKTLGQSVVTVLEKELKNYDDIVISSFKIDILKIVHSLNSQLRIGLLVSKEENYDTWQESMKELPYYSIHLHHSFLTESLIKSLHKQNYLIYTWTVNSVERAKELYTWGVDVIISDCPQILEKHIVT